MKHKNLCVYNHSKDSYRDSFLSISPKSFGDDTIPLRKCAPFAPRITDITGCSDLMGWSYIIGCCGSCTESKLKIIELKKRDYIFLSSTTATSSRTTFATAGLFSWTTGSRLLSIGRPGWNIGGIYRVGSDVGRTSGLTNTVIESVGISYILG